MELERPEKKNAMVLTWTIVLGGRGGERMAAGKTKAYRGVERCSIRGVGSV